MFIHVVMMSFKAEVDPAFHSRVQEFAARIRAECEGLQTYLYGANEANRGDGLTHAVVASFVDAPAHDRYQVSQVHQEMKAFMAQSIDRLVVFDSAHWSDAS